MPIHEKSLIRPENLVTHEKLEIDGVNVSGHWSTFIQSRVVTDYNEAMEEEIAALPGGEFIHRCWQCGSCTNSCTVNAINPDFNPRYWIYLTRLGMESITWQKLALNMASGLGLVIALFALFMLRHLFVRQPDKVQTAWLKLCRKLADAGLPRAAHEGAQDYAARVAKSRSDLADAIRDLAERYSALRYGMLGDELAQREFLRRAKALRI